MKHSSSAPGFSSSARTLSATRDHAEQLAHAVSDALAACSALQAATHQLRTAQSGGIGALGAWLSVACSGQLPASETSGPSLAEATQGLGVNLSLLEAEAAELNLRCRQLAAAQGEVTLQAHRWVRALLPDICLETVESLQGTLRAPQDSADGALRELCKRHPQAFVRSDLEAACKKTFADLDPLRLPALAPDGGHGAPLWRSEDVSMETTRPGNVKWGLHKGPRKARCAVSLTGRRCVSEGPGGSGSSHGDSARGNASDTVATPPASGPDRLPTGKAGRKGLERSMQGTKSPPWVSKPKGLAIDMGRDFEICKELRNTTAQLSAARAELTATRSELTFLKTFQLSETLDGDPQVQVAKISPPPHKLEDDVRKMKEQLKEVEAERSKMREQLAQAQVELSLLHAKLPEEEKDGTHTPFVIKKIEPNNQAAMKAELATLKDRLAAVDVDLVMARTELARYQEELAESQREFSMCKRELEVARLRLQERHMPASRRRDSKAETIDFSQTWSRQPSDQLMSTAPLLQLLADEDEERLQPRIDRRPTLFEVAIGRYDGPGSPPGPEMTPRTGSKSTPPKRVGSLPKVPLMGNPLPMGKVSGRRSSISHEGGKLANVRMRQRVRALWEKAARYCFRLIEVGRVFHVTEVHHRCTAVSVTDVCRRFGGLFDGYEVGIYEFVAQHVRAEEFNAQVSDLCSLGKGAARQQSKQAPVDLIAMEKVMKDSYDAAFEAAGGHAIAEACFPAANKAMRELQRARLHCRARQDAGFEIMSLDMLYATVRGHNDKLMREVSRIAERTKGEAKTPNLKGRPRSRAKVLTKYGNDTACLTDIMRASIIYNGIEDLYTALIWMCQEDVKAARRDFFILEINDRFQKSKDGYRDIAMLVDVDGVIGEVQLHVKTILDAKSSEGHDVYKQQRMINESLFEACVRNAQMDVASLAREYQVCARSIRDKNGRNALHYSCQTGALQTTRLLLRYRADPWVVDDHGVLACELALKHGNFDVTELMLKQMRAQPPSSDAAPRRLVGHVARWWCDHVAHEPEDGLQERWYHIGSGIIEIAQLCGVLRPLHEWFLEGASHGRLDRVRTMLRAGFDVAPGDGEPSALDLAIEYGHEDMAVLLIGFHSVDMRTLLCARCKSATVHAHLRKAAELEDARRAKTALAAKADPNHTTSKAHGNRTPLMAFAAAGKLDMVQRLVECGAHVAWYDKFGCSAVHYARVFCHEEIEKYLENIKSMPYLGSIPEGKLPTTYLPDAVREGCCAGVWRFVTSVATNLSREKQEDEWRRRLSQPLQPYNESLLHLAVQAAIDGKDPAGQVCRGLLQYRADPRAKNHKRDLPLHKAAGAGLDGIYKMLLEGMASGAGGHGVARAIERDALNEFGQAPKEMLENSLIHMGQKKEQAELHDIEILLRVAFHAFQHNHMGCKLRAWREEQAIHLFEILHSRWPFFAAGTEHLESGSNSCCSSGGESGVDESISPERTLTRARRPPKPRMNGRSPQKLHEHPKSHDASPSRQHEASHGAAHTHTGSFDGGKPQSISPEKSRGHWSNPSLTKMQFAIKMKRLQASMHSETKPEEGPEVSGS